jgi:hypothetical protein
MKHTVTFGSGLVVVLAIGLLLWPTPTAQAQQGCKSFQAIAQAAIPSSRPLGLVRDVWGGPLFGVLGDEFLTGVFSGNDGARESNAKIGQKRDGSYTMGFGCQESAGVYVCTDTITYEVANAIYTPPPGFGRYIGNTAKITGGTGQFQFASGNLNVNGPFIAWPDSSSLFKLSGRWNPEISGFVCGVQ